MPFYCFTKAHKNFSKSHLTLKVAPMCSKAHTIRHSASCQGWPGGAVLFGIFGPRQREAQLPCLSVALWLFVADWQSKQTKRKRCMYIQNLRQIWIWFDFKSFLEISINFNENWRCTCMSNIQIIEKKLFQKVTKSFNPNGSFRIALNSIQY